MPMINLLNNSGNNVSGQLKRESNLYVNTVKPGLVSKISHADELLSSLLRNAVNHP